MKTRDGRYRSKLARPEPTEDLTLIKAIKEYLRADPKRRVERNLCAINCLVEHFDEHYPLKDIKVADIRRYQRTRSQKFENGTVNRVECPFGEYSVFSWKWKEWKMNPCNHGPQTSRKAARLVSVMGRLQSCCGNIVGGCRISSPQMNLHGNEIQRGGERQVGNGTSLRDGCWSCPPR